MRVLLTTLIHFYQKNIKHYKEQLCPVRIMAITERICNAKFFNEFFGLIKQVLSANLYRALDCECLTLSVCLSVYNNY